MRTRPEELVREVIRKALCSRVSARARFRTSCTVKMLTSSITRGPLKLISIVSGQALGVPSTQPPVPLPQPLPARSSLIAEPPGKAAESVLDTLTVAPFCGARRVQPLGARPTGFERRHRQALHPRNFAQRLAALHATTAPIDTDRRPAAVAGWTCRLRAINTRRGRKSCGGTPTRRRRPCLRRSNR